MGLFKADFYRFFTIGFAAGALLVGVSMDGGFGAMVSGSVIPAAEAHAGQ